MIAYNPLLLNQYEPEMVLFLRAHEYGHIERRHIYTPPRFPQEELRMEREADCWAAQQLSQSAPAVLDRIVNLMTTKYATALGNLTHDNGVGIVATITRCRGTNSTRPERAPGNLSEVLSRFIAASGNHFQTLKGSYISRVGSDRKYASLLTLPGATDCAVWTDGEDTEVRCSMGAFARLSEAETAFDDLVETIKNALPRDWSSNEGHTSTLVLQHVRFTRTGEGPRISIQLTRNDYLRDNPNRLAVVFRK